MINPIIHQTYIVQEYSMMYLSLTREVMYVKLYSDLEGKDERMYVIALLNNLYRPIEVRLFTPVLNSVRSSHTFQYSPQYSVFTG